MIPGLIFGPNKIIINAKNTKKSKTITLTNNFIFFIENKRIRNFKGLLF